MCRVRASAPSLWLVTRFLPQPPTRWLVRRHHLQRYLVLSDPRTEQAQSPFLLEVEHPGLADPACSSPEACDSGPDPGLGEDPQAEDRKSTRLNSSHEWSSYAVFCLKKKKNN